jgi:hypothetical protein
MALTAPSRRSSSASRPPFPPWRTKVPAGHAKGGSGEFGQDLQAEVLRLQAELARQVIDHLAFHPRAVVLDVGEQGLGGGIPQAGAMHGDVGRDAGQGRVRGQRRQPPSVPQPDRDLPGGGLPLADDRLVRDQP